MIQARHGPQLIPASRGRAPSLVAGTSPEKEREKEMKRNENSPVLQDVVRWLRVFTAYEQGLSQISCPAEAAEMLADWQTMDVEDIPPALLGSDGPALLLPAWNAVIAPEDNARPGTVSARLNNPEESTTMKTTIDKKEEEETMKKYFIQFESGEGRNTPGAVNYMVCLDNPDLYAEIQVPESASDDYGYLALKDQIIAQAAAAGIDRSALEFWYDGQEQYLSQDASAGRAPRRISVDNGIHFVDPEEAVQAVPFETIAHYMDDSTREAVHQEGPETEAAFLRRYLELAQDDLIVG